MRSVLNNLRTELFRPMTKLELSDASSTVIVGSTPAIRSAYDREGDELSYILVREEAILECTFRVSMRR